MYNSIKQNLLTASGAHHPKSSLFPFPLPLFSPSYGESIDGYRTDKCLLTNGFQRSILNQVHLKTYSRKTESRVTYPQPQEELYRRALENYLIIIGLIILRNKEHSKQVLYKEFYTFSN